MTGRAVRKELAKRGLRERRYDFFGIEIDLVTNAQRGEKLKQKRT